MLTIGRLAAYVGVTVRAVRHYHQRGLLAEPERDASGYRRYDAQAVIDLIRIKTLSDAGVPLARIAELLDAGPESFARAVTEIDEALTTRIADLQRQRKRIAELVGGDRLFLPPEVTGYLDALRDAGVSPRSVRLERDGWIMLAARSPEDVRVWAKEKQAMFADPDFQRVYLAYDQARDWDPADPRLERLADDIVAFSGSGDDGSWATDDPLIETLVASQPGSSTPAWDRLNRLCTERMSGR
ncbi:MerR family transcriptional regulator [Actinomadura sp. DC4]|uniref:MerR family transcriptional regulator n=1 Tax=Actinomadura sp. DC4 TaxID=3055069 RepID=UPI0025B22005|nr:MerR family transcriptional regulator [Actinomadura sp. DC4]MDN3353137.1 MerR family transcriptional regulator [Actinomadura sp. DC4]